MKRLKNIITVIALALLPVLTAAQDTTSFNQIPAATTQTLTGQVPVVQADSTVRMTIELFNQYIIDSIADLRDTSQALRDSVNVNKDLIVVNQDSLASHLDLRDLYKLSPLGEQSTVEVEDTLFLKKGAIERKITLQELLLTTNQTLTLRESEIEDLTATVAAQAVTIAAIQTVTDFDTIIYDLATNKVWMYIPLPTGQVKAILDVETIEDNVLPTVLSITVEDSEKDLIIITMSKYLEIADSSINRFTGAEGSVFVQMDAAYVMDVPTGNLLDEVGVDEGTTQGTIIRDSVGVAGTAYDFDGVTGYVALQTGINYGTNDHSGYVDLKPHSLAADFRIYSADADGFFIGYNAEFDGLWVGKTGVDVSPVTDLDLAVNVWNRVAWAEDQSANTVTFWIDGVSEVESYEPDGATYAGASKYIGSSAGASSFFNGLMDNLLLFDDYKLVQSTVDSLATHRFNQSGGGQLVFQDSIKAVLTLVTSIGSPTIDSLFIASNKVNLRLSDNMFYGSTFSIAYQESTGYGIRDTAGNFAGSWPAFSGINNVDTTVANDYIILEEWDFESESLGAFGTSDLEALLGTYRIPATNYTTSPEIVSQTINGVARNVLKITNDEGLPDPITGYYGGLNHQFGLDSNFTEVNVSYNFMIDPNVAWTPDFKLNGFHVGFVALGGPPLYAHGFRAQGYLKFGGEFNSYFYMHNYQWGAWDKGTPDLDSVYVVPGVWYSMTLRARLNDAGSENGIFEAALDGQWKNQSVGLEYIEDPSMDIDGIGIKEWTGGDGPANMPDSDWHTYVANITIWTPLNDNIFGSGTIHDPDVIFGHPYPITDKDFYYEGSIITTESTLTNDAWGSPYGSSEAEYHLLDAGPGDQVRITFNSGTSIGSNDYLFFYDAEYAGSNLLGKYVGTGITAGTTIESTGRYMYVYFTSANYSGYGDGWSFAITHF